MKTKEIPFRTENDIKGFVERVLERVKRNVESLDESDLRILQTEYDKYKDASLNWLITRTFSKLVDISGDLGFYVGSLPDVDFSDTSKRISGYRAVFINDHKAFAVRYKGRGNPFKTGSEYKVKLGRSGYSRGEPEITKRTKNISQLKSYLDNIATSINKVDQYETVVLKVVISDLFNYKYWLSLKEPIKRVDKITNKELPDKRNEKAGETKFYSFRVPGTETVLKEFSGKVKGNFKNKLTILFNAQEINQVMSDSISLVFSAIDTRRDQISVEIPPAVQSLYRSTLHFPYRKETMQELKQLYSQKEWEPIESMVRTEFLHQQVYIVGIVDQIGDKKADKKGKAYRFRSMSAAFVAVDDSYEMPEGFIDGDEDESDDDSAEIDDFESTSSVVDDTVDDDDFYDEESEVDDLPEIKETMVKDTDSVTEEVTEDSEDSGSSEVSEADDFEEEEDPEVAITEDDFEVLESNQELSKSQKNKLDEMLTINAQNPDVSALANAVGVSPDLVQEYIDSNLEKFAKQTPENLLVNVKTSLDMKIPKTIPTVVKELKKKEIIVTQKEVAIVIAKLLAKDEVVEGPAKRYRILI